MSINKSGRSNELEPVAGRLPVEWTNKMCRLISEQKPKARKAYDCMAYEYLNNMDALSNIINDMTYSEKRAVVRAMLNGGKILPGQVYIRQFMDWGGEKGTYRAIQEIHDICTKYDVFDEC